MKYSPDEALWAMALLASAAPRRLQDCSPFTWISG